MVTQVLLLGCVIALLLAMALALWHGPARRQQQQDASRHVDSILQAAKQTAGTPRDASPAGMRTSEQSFWQTQLMRADLTPTTRTALLLTVPPVLLALFAWARTGSFLMGVFALALSLCAIALWGYRRITRIQRRLVAQLPDFLEHMVRIAAVGNSLPMAFQGATSNAVAPLRPILDNAQLYTRAGMDLDRALHQAAIAYRVQPLEMLAVVMGTSMRIGGRSDQILQRMADFMRDLEQAQREFSATTSETRMSAWVIGLLPLACGLMMAMMNPDFFTPMFTEPLGRKVLMMAVGLELVGVTLLWRLARSI
jgi:tight adherence protein B